MRIGTLGAARIAPMALVRPARQVDGIEVAGVAARDPARAQKFAARHGIPQWLDSYDALLEQVDAVYIPLPNGLHGHWTSRALAAGCHVLCEKPFTANREEARTVAELARERGRTVMEAFHYRYHPLAERIREIAQRELGSVRHVETAICVPLPLFSDIRYRLDLAGGAMMDTGCYALHLLRLLAPGQPRVVSAKALERSPGVDRAMTAELELASGATGRISCSLWSSNVLRVSARVVGEEATLQVLNPIMPHFFHRIKVMRHGRSVHWEKILGEATYTHQLRAFVAAVNGDAAANLTPPQDSVINMGLIDDVYRAAGMEPRQPSAHSPRSMV